VPATAKLKSRYTPLTTQVSINNYNKSSLYLLLFTLDFDVFFELLVVGGGIIASKVHPSTFPAHLGGAGHKPGDGEHILAFPSIVAFKDFIHDIALPEHDNLLCLS